MSKLSNTEKFAALKKLNDLKMKYHKEGITDFFNFPFMDVDGDTIFNKTVGFSMKAFHIFRFFKSKK